MKQGDVIAPLLVNNIVLEIVISSETETQGTIFDKPSHIMAYVDVVIMRRRLQDVEIFTSLVKQTNYMGLEIHEKQRQNAE